MSKRIIKIFFCFMFINTLTFATEAIAISTTLLDKSTAQGLISQNFNNTILTKFRSTDIKPDQSFRINIDSRNLWVISVLRKTSSDANLSTCSVLLFGPNGSIQSFFDTVGYDDEKRPWYCDYVEAMSFRGSYPDGSLLIIAIYLATPFSSERFTLPVVMKLDLKKPSLEIDEVLTKELEGKDVKTVQDARALLKRHNKKVFLH